MSDKLERDYYQMIGVEDAGEPWNKWLPVMRVYGGLVLVGTLLIAQPWRDPGGTAGLLAVALIAGLLVAFGVMWVYRPIWQHHIRTLAIHGVFQVAAYGVLVAISPAFLGLALLVYPQVLFSLPIRWAMIGGVLLGAIGAYGALSAAEFSVTTALPGAASSLFAALMLMALALWIRETISQSLERRVLIGRLEKAQADLAAAERAAGVAEERSRLAREIHDTLAQGFASIATHLEAADADMARGGSRAREDVRVALEVARTSLGEARTLVWALRPDSLAATGLAGALERLAASGGSTPRVEVTVSGTPRQLHPDVEVTLLRAAQEAIANARRHAAASCISLTLTYFGDQVSLDVIDDGKGFDASGAARSGGLGLVGMRERAQRLGGTLSIESSADDGTAIAVTLPAIDIQPETDGGARR